jgi:hypothetical protein
MMNITHSFQTGETPKIVLQHVQGDLSIQGWTQPEVTLVADDATADDHTETGGALEIRCDGDCRLQVPFGASIHALAVGGDTRVSQVNGTIELESINGDLQLKSVGRTSLGSVKGDFAIYHAEGDLSVKSVRGDAKAHIVNGVVSMESVSGDLRIQHTNGAIVGGVSGDLMARDIHGDFHIENVGGDANVGNVEGSFVGSSIGDDLTLAEIAGNVQVTAGDDVSLRLTPNAGANYVVFAGGDATCRVPYECSAAVALQAGGAVSVHRFAVEAGENPHHCSFTLGNGESTLAITAGGDISFGGSDMKWEDTASGADAAMELGLRAGELVQQVASQVEMQVQAATSQLDRKLTELADNDDLVLRIQDKVQAAMNIAETKIAEAMGQAEQSIKEAQERAAKSEAQNRRQQQSWKVSTPPKPAKPASPPVSDEERLIILGMVDQGKISVEQAEQLLQALRPKATK